MSAISERHVQNEWPDTVCKGCRDDWPCDTELMRRERDAQAHRADEAEAASGGGLLLFQKCADDRDRYRQQRDALAECARDLWHEYHALGLVRDHWSDPDTGKIGDAPVDIATCDDVYCRDTRAALDAIKEEKK